MDGVPGAEMSGPVIPLKVGDMTADDDSTRTTEPVKTETDLRVEALEKEIASMKASHEQQVKELSEANRGLWAALHPVQEGQPAPAAGPAPGEVAYKVLADKLGLKAKE